MKMSENIFNKQIEHKLNVNFSEDVIENCVEEKLLLSKTLNNKLIEIKRESTEWEKFCAKNRRIQKNDDSLYEQILIKSRNVWNKSSILLSLKSLFPIIDWLPKYDVKNDLWSDIIVGFTISILVIPQGIAYSLLAGLEAVNGLYISLFPVLIYSLMGTSRHLSIGSFAVASLMISNTASNLGSVPSHITFINQTTNETVISDWPPTTLEVLTTVCLITGLLQVLMGFMSLGSLSLILSDHLVSGFSTGVAFHVCTSQMNNILGLNIPNQRSGAFKLIKSWSAIYQEFGEINIFCLIFSGIQIAILLIYRECLEPRIKKRSAYPLPIDLLLILISTIVSYNYNIKENFNMKIVGSVPTGLPTPKIPRLDFIPLVFVDCLITGIVLYAITLSLGKIFAKKHRYEVNANQELIALGFANIFSSFFLTYTSSGSLSRSSVQERIGGRTQITGLVSCFVILIVLLYFAQSMYFLPKSTLSCIILVALKSMVLQITEFKKIWSLSRLDGMVWMVTFVSLILLDVELGLIMGVIVSLFVVILQIIRPYASTLGWLPLTEIYVNMESFKNAKEFNGLKILRYCSPIFFLTIDRFRNEVLNKLNTNESFIDDNKYGPKPDTIIIDLSCVQFVDKSGVETIIDMINILNDQNVCLCLASCQPQVMDVFEKMKFFDKIKNPCIFPTIHDAVVCFQ